MAYYFMMGVVPLPIPPSSLSIKTPSMNETVTLINEGEINIPKDQGLREISFEFLLPTVQKYPFATWQLGDHTATVLIPLLNIWKRSRLPFPFIVTRMSPTGKFLYFTSILCVIEDFEYKEDAEEYGLDTMCSITLKEYKPYSTKRVKADKPGSKPGSNKGRVEKTRDTTGKSQPKKITTKKNETVISGAKKTGDKIGYVFDSNDIKMPDSISNPVLDDNSWMEEILPDVELDKLQNTQSNNWWMEEISTGTDLDKTIQFSTNSDFNSMLNGPSSAVDAVLSAPSTTQYARPSVPAGVGYGGIRNPVETIERLNYLGFKFENLAGGI